MIMESDIARVPADKTRARMIVSAVEYLRARQYRSIKARMKKTAPPGTMDIGANGPTHRFDLVAVAPDGQAIIGECVPADISPSRLELVLSVCAHSKGELEPWFFVSAYDGLEFSPRARLEAEIRDYCAQHKRVPWPMIVEVGAT